MFPEASVIEQVGVISPTLRLTTRIVLEVVEEPYQKLKEKNDRWNFNCLICLCVSTSDRIKYSNPTDVRILLCEIRVLLFEIVMMMTRLDKTSKSLHCGR